MASIGWSTSLESVPPHTVGRSESILERGGQSACAQLICQPLVLFSDSLPSGTRLIELFRPEFLYWWKRNGGKPLCCDMINATKLRSEDKDVDPNIAPQTFQKLREIQQAATTFLKTEMITRLASRLQALPSVLDIRGLVSLLHFHGINIRYLPYLYSALTDPGWRKLVLSEVVARSCKNHVRELFREVSNVSNATHVVNLINLLTGAKISKGTNVWHTVVLKNTRCIFRGTTSRIKDSAITTGKTTVHIPEVCHRLMQLLGARLTSSGRRKISLWNAVRPVEIKLEDIIPEETWCKFRICPLLTFRKGFAAHREFKTSQKLGDIREACESYMQCLESYSLDPLSWYNLSLACVERAAREENPKVRSILHSFSCAARSCAFLSDRNLPIVLPSSQLQPRYGKRDKIVPPAEMHPIHAILYADAAISSSDSAIRYKSPIPRQDMGLAHSRDALLQRVRNVVSLLQNGVSSRAVTVNAFVRERQMCSHELPLRSFLWRAIQSQPMLTEAYLGLALLLRWRRTSLGQLMSQHISLPETVAAKLGPLLPNEAVVHCSALELLNIAITIAKTKSEHRLLPELFCWISLFVPPSSFFSRGYLQTLDGQKFSREDLLRRALENSAGSSLPFTFTAAYLSEAKLSEFTLSSGRRVKSTDLDQLMSEVDADVPDSSFVDEYSHQLEEVRSGSSSLLV
jgi:hypothetical protein